MKKLFITFLASAALLSASQANAQTNLQTQYDFDRECITSTVEMFKSDGWGNTYFFVDYDYTLDKAVNSTTSPTGSYFEFARCINFWGESFLKDLSIQAEYNGGLGRARTMGYGINHAFLAGFDYFLHTKDYKNSLNVKVLYKTISDATQLAPLQFTLTWGCDDIFGVSGLRFSGFADVWFQDQYFGLTQSQTTFLSEPQLWYNVGRYIGVDNLSIGGEVEFAVNFTELGFKCRPCAGLKWTF